MTPSEFIKNVKRTESPFVPTKFSGRILHAVMGCVTEAGEMADNVKKHLFYKGDIDKQNLIEEAGDLLWYLAILLDELEVDFSKVMALNIEKLKARYPNKFDKQKAFNRNLDAERKVFKDENRNKQDNS